MKTLDVLTFVASRLKEPSTWASFAAALAAANISVAPGVWAKITLVGTAAAVCLGVLLSEVKKAETQTPETKETK